MVDPRRRDEIDYAEITQMIDACLDMVSNGDSTCEAHVWLLALTMRITERRDELLARWPYPQTLHNDHVWTRDIGERLLASMVIWYIELAMHALNDGDTARAMNEIAHAGCALYLCGAEGQGSDSLINAKYRQSKRAQLAANAAHTAHARARQTARDWYAAHKDRFTKDAAAQKIHDERIIVASYRTIRDYLTGQ